MRDFLKVCADFYWVWLLQNVVLEDSDKSDVLRSKRGYDKQYSFDVVFGEESTQEEVYEITTSSLVKDVLNG